MAFYPFRLRHVIDKIVSGASRRDLVHCKGSSFTYSPTTISVCHFSNRFNSLSSGPLNELLKKASACQISRTVSLVEQFRRAMQQGCEVSVKELDTIMTLLMDKKRKMEQEEAERNLHILLDFLHCLRKQKVDELSEVWLHFKVLQWLKGKIL